MRYTKAILFCALLCPFFLRAEDFPEYPLKVAKANYVQIRAYHLDDDGNTTDSGATQATGVFIGNKYVLSCHHILMGKTRPYYKQYALTAVWFNPSADMVIYRIEPVLVPDAESLFDNSIPIPAVSWRPAKSVKVGEEIFVYGNAHGHDGMARHAYVSRVSEAWIFLDRPLIAGESGSGFFNRAGELVGIASFDESPDDAIGRLSLYKNLGGALEYPPVKEALSGK